MSAPNVLLPKGEQADDLWSGTVHGRSSRHSRGTGLARYPYLHPVRQTRSEGTASSGSVLTGAELSVRNGQDTSGNARLLHGEAELPHTHFRRRGITRPRCRLPCAAPTHLIGIVARPKSDR
jgi:hypothetical protein